MSAIVLTLHIPWKMVDAGSTMLDSVTIPSGRYAAERINNPLHASGTPWLVIKGTKIGANECFFRRMDEKNFDSFRISVEESTTDPDLPGRIPEPPLERAAFPAS